MPRASASRGGSASSLLALSFVALAALLASCARAQSQNPCPTPTDPDTNTFLTLFATAAIVFQGTFHQPTSVTGQQVLIATLNASQAVFQLPGLPSYWATECVFRLAVNYTSNLGLIVSGVPTAIGQSAQQRCWRVSVVNATTGAAEWSVSALNFAATSGVQCKLGGTLPAFVASGTITGYGQVTTPVIPTCAAPSSVAPSSSATYTTLLGEDPNSPPAFVLAPTYFSVVYPLTSISPANADLVYLTSCISAVYSVPASGATGAYQLLDASGAACFSLQPSFTVPPLLGFFNSYLTGPGACPVAPPAVVPWALPPSGGDPFLISSPAAPPPAPTPGPRMVNRAAPCVVFAVSMTDPTNEATMHAAEVLLNACFVFALRRSFTPPGASLNATIITSVQLPSTFATPPIPGAIIALAPAFPGNAYDVPPWGSNPCGVSSRRALSEALAGGWLEGAALSAPGARLLQAGPATAVAAVTIISADEAARNALLATLQAQTTPYVFPQAAFAAAASAVGLPAPGTISSSAPQGPQPSVTIIRVPVYALPRVAPYAPSALILSAHAQPRLGGASNVLPTSFSISSPTAVGTDPYLKGVVLPAAVLIGFGVVGLVVFGVAYACACCRCCLGLKCRRNRLTYYTGVRKYVGPERALVFFAVVNLALVLSAIAYVPGFAQGVNSVGSTLTTIYSTLYNTSAIVGTSVTTTGLPQQVLFIFPVRPRVRAPPPPSLPARLTHRVPPTARCAERLAVSAVQRAGLPWRRTKVCVRAGATRQWGLSAHAPPPPLASADVAAMSANASSDSKASTTQKALITALARAWGPAVSTVQTAGQSIASAVVSFEPTKNAVISATNTYAALVTLSGTIILALAASLIFLQAVSVCRNRCACYVFKGLAPLTLLLTSLIFILSGVFFAVGLVGSDVCYDPNAVLGNLASTLIAGEGGQTASYYLECGPSPYTATAGTLVERVQAGLVQINAVSALTADLQTQVDTDNYGA